MASIICIGFITLQSVFNIFLILTNNSRTSPIPLIQVILYYILVILENNIIASSTLIHLRKQTQNMWVTLPKIHKEPVA
jgi:hypothetical protein